MTSEMELTDADHSSNPSPEDQMEDAPAPWYKAPVYAFYWRQYQRMWPWFHMHQLTHRGHEGLLYRLGQQKSFHLHWAQWLENYQRLLCRGKTPGPCGASHVPSSDSLHTSRHKRKSKRKFKRRLGPHKKICIEKPISATPANVTDLELSFQEESDSEVDEFHMEFTPEMLDFFSQSAKHRQERDAKKGDQEALKFKSVDYVDLADGKDSPRHQATILPPSERPGVKRTTEMKYLYGQGAAMIHGMETAMQLNFDRNCDRKAPKLWPNLPLNIQFS